MKNNKISWIALGIALIAVIVSFVVGGINQPQQIIREIIEKPSLGGPTRFSQVGAGDAIEFWKRISLAAGDQLECVQNITGSTIFVDPLQTQVHLTGNGSASTSQTLNIATSSDGVNIGGLESFVGGGYYTGSSSVDVDSIRESGLFPFAGILDSYIISTSTTDTPNYGTSSPAVISYLNTFASTTGGRLNAGPGWVTIPETQYVCALLTATYEHPLVSPCNSTVETVVADNACEQATSTARGFNLDVFLKFIATSTLNNL